MAKNKSCGGFRAQVLVAPFSGKEKPHVRLFFCFSFFLFDTSLKLVRFAFYLTKESHMLIRVGLVLLTMTNDYGP